MDLGKFLPVYLEVVTLKKALQARELAKALQADGIPVHAVIVLVVVLVVHGVRRQHGPPGRDGALES